MTLDRPYFMTNEKWYRYDEEEGICVLTDEAPAEAVKSYKEFYEMLDSATIYPDI